jgi:hypothetical protein
LNAPDHLRREHLADPLGVDRTNLRFSWHERSDRRTAVEQTGAFLCSDRLVNRIHENVLWGQRSNLMSAPTDCLQRGERMGWLGDAQLASEEAV